MRKHGFVGYGVVLASLLVAACGGEKKKEAPSLAGQAGEQAAAGEQARSADKKEEAPHRIDLASEPVKPLPEKVEDVDIRKAELGRRLYFDPLLSGDGTVSCASCHSFARNLGGADGRAGSIGIGGQRGPISAPTVLNARYNIAQFWDGRAKDLQEQAMGPVENPKEMGDKWENVVEKVKKDEWYAKQFLEVFKGEITKETITEAIAEYEKTLVTPAPFDRYLRGDPSAIDEQAKAGYALFKEVGCATCHNGIAVGGGMFQRMGVVRNYFEERGGEVTEADLGRFNVTKNEADKHVFKVPTLRNVALTAPYFHDGFAKTLEEAVRLMARFQLGKELDDEQVGKIVAFLKSLTGRLPEQASPPPGFERAMAEPLPEPAAQEGAGGAAQPQGGQQAEEGAAKH